VVFWSRLVPNSYDLVRLALVKIQKLEGCQGE